MTDSSSSAAVVVGASLGGLRAAAALRTFGFPGPITLVGDEPHPPYDRPPLSKEVLTGEKQPSEALLRPPEFFEEQGIVLRLGTAAVGWDAASRTVRLANGEELAYDAAVVATGSRARRLPGVGELPGLHVMRTLDDAAAIRSSLETARRLVVAGAGFIGSEVAASARSRGLEVIIAEAAEQPLAAAVGREVGERCAALHGRYGTELRCGTGVSGVRREASELAVELSDGSEERCGAMVVGIGVIPNTEWLEGSGMETERGAVVCDRFLRTSLPDVYAVGDLAAWDSRRFGGRIRVEHWTNTVEQAAAAARNICNVMKGEEPVAYDGVPYFWSDQYGHRLQLAGLASEEEAAFVDDPLDEPGLLTLYRRGDRLGGVFAIDRVGPLMKLRRLLLQDASFTEALDFASNL